MRPKDDTDQQALTRQHMCQYIFKIEKVLAHAVVWLVEGVMER